jgi:hypothetical protein
MSTACCAVIFFSPGASTHVTTAAIIVQVIS